jgi:subtilisin family serine protease
MRPAWSTQFTQEELRAVKAVYPLEDITPEWAWGDSTGQNVKVAVIDSGVDRDHPAIGGRVSGYVSVTETAEGIVYDTSPHGDEFGHGNACAGIIRTLAPDCELYSVKVLGPRLTGKGSVFTAGLRWAIENDMQICNLSLGTTRRDFFAVLHELADHASFRNIVLVTAANNLPTPSFPSVFASVISVASHEWQTPDIYFYNPEPPVDFGAPGIDVRVAWQNGEWITATGNSFAAPHITGLVAKILGKHPDLAPFQVKTVLRALAANVSHDLTIAHPARSPRNSNERQ